MSDDVLSRIEQKLDVLLAIAAEKPPVGTVPGPVADLVGPGVVEVGGARMNLLEPLFSGWKPSYTEVLLTRYGRMGVDPSNAPNGYPRRSPGGFPLSYAIGEGGRPVGPARIVYDGRTFDTEADVAKYDAAVAARADTSAPEADATGAYPVSNLLPIEMHGDDWRYVYYVSTSDPARYKNATRRLLNGPAADIARGMSWAHVNYGDFNPGGYAGVMIEVVKRVYD